MNIRDIDTKLEAAFDKLHHLQAEMRDIGINAAEAKVAYEVAQAQAFLLARDKGMVVESAKAEALLAASEKNLAYLIADTEVRTNRSALQTLNTQVDILRTMAASHRSTF